MYLRKTYSLQFDSIERGETDDKHLYKKYGQDAFLYIGSQQLISVTIQPGTDVQWWLISETEPYPVRGGGTDDVLDFGGEEEFTPDFDPEKYAVYIKKSILIQEVEFKLPLPEGMSDEEALMEWDNRSLSSFLQLCGIPDVRSSSLSDQTFEGFGDTKYFAEDSRVWEAKYYKDPILPIKVDYIKVLEQAESNSYQGNWVEDDWED